MAVTFTFTLGDQHSIWSNQTEHLEPPQILPEPPADGEGEDPLASLPLGSILQPLLLGEGSGEGRDAGSPSWLWWEGRLSSPSVSSAHAPL